MTKSEIERALIDLHTIGMATRKHHHQPKTLQDRKCRSKHIPMPLWFEYHLDKTSACWIWTGVKDRKGYGRVRVDTKKMMAHRYAFQIWSGPIPDGMMVCHKCDNPPCCNPDHLFLGTARDNLMDSIQKGRFRPGITCGQNCHFAKLTTAQALDIKTSKIQTKFLAKKFGVSRNAIGHIRAGRTWAHLPDAPVPEERTRKIGDVLRGMRESL